MADALIDVGLQNRHAGEHADLAIGCWRDRGGRVCDLEPDPDSPTGLCPTCRNDIRDQEQPMTGRHKPPRNDRDTRTARELLRLARRELDHIEHLLAWREADLDGVRVEETVGGGSNVASDPTMGQSLSRSHVAAKIDRARARLAALVDSTLPSIYGTLRLDDERRREDDQHRTVDGQDVGPAELHGGVSAYRGDERAPSGRPDLREALAAQRRRIDAGKGYGHG